MKCPKCHSEIEEKSVKCPNCHTRIGRFCPVCKEYNLLTTKKCINCEEVLLITCPACNKINLPNATTCRKCGYILKQQPKPQKNNNINTNVSKNISYLANYTSPDTCKKIILDAIKAENIKIISLNGKNDYAKSKIIKSIKKHTANEGIALLLGTCTSYTQLTPLGYIQAMLLNLFNIANFCISKKQLQKESIDFFKNDFANLSQEEVYDLLNILYPESIDDFSNIEKNKNKTINIIIKVFETIVSKMPIVLLIESIEYIDTFSFEILNICMENENIRNKLTYILTYEKEQSASNCFTLPCLHGDAYMDLTVENYKKDEIDDVLISYKNIELPSHIKQDILKYGNNDIILIEQLVYMAKESMDTSTPVNFSSELNVILESRLKLLKNNDNSTYLILLSAILLGFKFNPTILTNIFGMDTDEINKRISKLERLNFIAKSGNLNYTFKTVKLWEILTESIKKDIETFKAVNQALYSSCNGYCLSSYAPIAYICQNLNYLEQAYMIWSKCTNHSAYIGDTALYILLHNHTLNLIDKIDIENPNEYKSKIYAELGILLEKTDYKKATEYLSKAVLMLPDNDISSKIKLSSYLASALMKQDNYYGIIECIDNILKTIPQEELPVETAIIKSRKLKALLNIGSCGEIVSLTENDIIPVLESCLNGKLVSKILDLNNVFSILINTYLYIAETYILQGTDKAFKVLDYITSISNTNEIQDKLLPIKIKFLYAFANTITGDIQQSDKIIEDLLQEKQCPPNILTKIYTVNILNNFLSNPSKITYDNLYKITKYAEDNNAQFIKNILKLFLGRLMHINNQHKESVDIYTKQIEYFADKQNAIGVLLGWYFISDTYTITEGAQKSLDIALKALDISNSASISNFYFILLFNKLIAEIYLTMKDYDAAKMYIDKAKQIAENYNLHYQLASIYLLYSKYLMNYSNNIPDKKADYALSVQKTINMANDINNNLQLVSLSDKINKTKEYLHSFCEINEIILK